MATRFYCDVCGDEITAEEYRSPRPNETKIAVPLGGCMCKKCVVAFNLLDITKIIRDSILDARVDIARRGQS